ncbi:hypothetical protein MNBD_IGNAVI01-2656 [hydrothermal vent metagenome]|uniref:Uncharacterized protein n=1 Tax=hydrothermal vent metagenome TaxID=652676 RepID=A0A3B1BKU0_9ZZZZ
MGRIKFILIVHFIFILSSLHFYEIYAQPKIGGFLQLDKRFYINDNAFQLDDFYNRFRFETSISPNDKLYLFTSVDFRFYDVARVNELNDLENIDQLFPTNISLWEAYVSLYGFLFDDLDLKIGKQRISWGTADKLNQTDNLNSKDFSDIINFTEKIPSWAIKTSYYLGDYTLTAVWLPNFEPVLLPRNGTSLFLDDDLTSLKDSVILPESKLSNSMFAFKLSSNFAGLDYSFSYFNGYDDIPILTSLNYTSDPDSGSMGKAELSFPKIQVIGVDFSTEISGIGFWGEGALIIPEKIITYNSVNGVHYTTVALDDKPYFKFTLGGDYTFPDGYYLNVQWMHGFFTERGSTLNDYFFARLEKTLFNDQLKIGLGGVLEVAKWDKISEYYGYGFLPELTYMGIDNIEIAIGTFLVGGTPFSMLGSWKNVSQAYFRLKVVF